MLTLRQEFGRDLGRILKNGLIDRWTSWMLNKGWRCMCTNRKLTALTVLLVVVSAAVMGGFLLATRAADATATGNTTITPFGDNGFFCLNNSRMGEFGGRHGPRGGHYGLGQIQVSEEYKTNVINIAKNDTDVQNLLAEGYNITSIRPEISTVIDGEGYVTTKANTAYILLQKDTTSFASAKVDLEQAMVTEIVIFTKTVIEKP